MNSSQQSSQPEPMNPFSFEIRHKEFTHYVTASGEIDVYNSPDFKKIIVEALNTAVDPNHCIIIDMTKVEYLDSTALGILISGYKHSVEKDLLYLLIVSNQRLRRIFELTGLDKVFPIFENEDCANEAIKSHRLVG